MKIITQLIDSLLDKSPRHLFYHSQRKLFKNKLPKNFNDQRPCVFVLSTGRVGTKTLAALFNLAPNVFSYHEPRPKLYGISKLSYQVKAEGCRDLILREAFLTCRTDLINYSLCCRRGYIETSPQITFLAPIIKQVIPEACFIHVIRNPYDVVISGMRRKWYAGHPKDNTRIVPHPDSEIFLKWKNFNQLQKNIWLWAETNKWIFTFTKKLPREQSILIYSEDIFRGKERALKDLFYFINAPLPPLRKINNILMKKFNKQKTNSFPPPSVWTREMKEQLYLIAGPTARLLGYDL